MNNFSAIGNLTFDPADALQFTPSGQARLRFQIAINNRKKNAQTGEMGRRGRVSLLRLLG